MNWQGEHVFLVSGHVKKVSGHVFLVSGQEKKVSPDVFLVSGHGYLVVGRLV